MGRPVEYCGGDLEGEVTEQHVRMQTHVQNTIASSSKRWMTCKTAIRFVQ